MLWAHKQRSDDRCVPVVLHRLAEVISSPRDNLAHSFQDTVGGGQPVARRPARVGGVRDHSRMAAICTKRGALAREPDGCTPGRQGIVRNSLISEYGNSVEYSV
jgi:hypothetical protein